MEHDILFFFDYFSLSVHKGNISMTWKYSDPISKAEHADSKYDLVISRDDAAESRSSADIATTDDRYDIVISGAEDSDENEIDDGVDYVDRSL